MFVTTLTIITLFCAGYFFLLNFSKRKEGYNRSLMLFLVVATCQQILICGLKVWSRDELYLGLSLPFGLLFGPAILFLVNSLKRYPTGPKFIGHFAPFLASITLFGSMGLKQWMLFRYHIESILLMHLLSLLHFSVYMTYIILKNQMETDEDLFKLIKRYGIKAYISLSLIGLLIIEIFIMISHNKHVLVHELFVLSFFLAFLLILSLLYRQAPVDQGKLEGQDVNNCFPEVLLDVQMAPPPISSSVYKRECLYRQRLQQFINSKAYLDTELNKEKFCHQLGIPLNNISPFLKKEFGKGFNAFINHLRVNYAATQLKNAELQTTVDDLSFVCGFNSRASFYRSFHSEFGCTPLQFLKNAG